MTFRQDEIREDEGQSEIHLNKYAVRERPHGVLGRRLRSGEVLLATDVYESTSGRWEPCPCPGIRLLLPQGENSSAVLWVRPE